MTYKIQIDNLLFHVDVTEYSPAIPGSYDKNAASDYDYYGIPEELSWECNEVVVREDCITLQTIYGEEAYEIVDVYAEQITSKLLDKIHFEQECAEEIYV